MRSRSGKGSWARRILFLLNLGAFAAVLLSTRRNEPWWLGMLLLVWGTLSAGFFRWLDWRVRPTATPDGRAPQRPSMIETLAALQTPPPRAVRSEVIARLVRQYRRAYPPLLALPILLGVSWFWPTDAVLKYQGVAAVRAMILCALVTAMVVYVESNVRAVRRLVREGEVLHGAVADVSHFRDRATVRFSFAGAPLDVSVPLHEAGDLEPELPVPILVASGSRLVGVITASATVVVARMQR